VPVEWVCSLGDYLPIGGGLLCSDLALLLNVLGRVHEPPPRPLMNKHVVSGPQKASTDAPNLSTTKRMKMVILSSVGLGATQLGSSSHEPLHKCRASAPGLDPEDGPGTSTSTHRVCDWKALQRGLNPVKAEGSRFMRASLHQIQPPLPLKCMDQLQDHEHND
jgi:hypothetical protein